MQLPLISVITVVYNDIAHIVETLDSVTAHDYPQIEYIIIDGASSDGTREKIMEYIASCANTDSKKYEEQNGRIYLEATHREKNLLFKFLSEADSGIYDAMNKGIDLATGEWCNFMNCGDRFYSPNTILELFTRFLVTNTTIRHISVIYGDTHTIYDNTYSKVICASTRPHNYHQRFTHQSAFILTTLMKQYKYDTYFKIAADADFFTKIYRQDISFYYIPLTISSFNMQGISSAPSWQRFKEYYIIANKYSHTRPILLGIKYFCWTLPRYYVYLIIPKKYRNYIRMLCSKKHS